MKKMLAMLIILAGAAILGGKAPPLGNKATIYDRTGLYPKAQIKKDAFKENSWTIYDKNGFIPEGKIKLRRDGKYHIYDSTGFWPQGIIEPER